MDQLEKKIDETLEGMQQLSYNELVEVARRAVSKIVPLCKFLDIQSGGCLFIAVIFEHALNADGGMSEKEKKFMEDVFGAYKEDVEKWMPIKPDAIDVMLDVLLLFVSLEGEAKMYLGSLVSALLVCDNHIADSEKSYFKTLVEKIY